MKKINCMLALACMSLSTLFVGCQRNGDMPNNTNANSKVNHLIFKEVFYIGYLTYRELPKEYAQWGMKSQYSRYTDANYLVIANPTDKPISLANMAIAVHGVDPSVQHDYQDNGDGSFVKRYYGIGGMSYFPNDPVTNKPHIIQPGDSVIIVKYACDHKKKFFKENEITEEDAKKSYFGWEALPDYSKLPKDKTFELCNQREPNPDDEYDNKDIPNMKDLVLWDDLPFSGVDQSMRIALVKLPDGDATKPHTEDAKGYYPDESPRSRHNWYHLYAHYADEQNAIKDENDPEKKAELKKNCKYPTAYYEMVQEQGGGDGVNLIELNYNWVVDFLTICPPSLKKFSLLEAPSELLVYDGIGHIVKENGKEKREKVWWYDNGSTSVCNAIYGTSDFADDKFNPALLQGALIRRTDGKGFVAQMSSALNFTKGVPSLCKRDEKGKPTFNAEAYWKVNSIQARTKKK